MKLKVLKPVFGQEANRLVNTVGQYNETILFKREHWVVDVKSILGVLALALQPGQEVEVNVMYGEQEDILKDIISLGIFEQVQ